MCCWCSPSGAFRCAGSSRNIILESMDEKDPICFTCCHCKSVYMLSLKVFKSLGALEMQSFAGTSPIFKYSRLRGGSWKEIRSTCSTRAESCLRFSEPRHFCEAQPL